MDHKELYDLETDPGEMVNQYGNAEYAKVVEALERELLHLKSEYGVPEPARK